MSLDRCAITCLEKAKESSGEGGSMSWVFRGTNGKPRACVLATLDPELAEKLKTVFDQHEVEK